MSFSGEKVKEIIERRTPATLYEKECEQINLGHMDPAEIRIEDYMGKEDEGILYVDHAGEILYRLE